jgi:hypothetical protein
MGQKKKAKKMLQGPSTTASSTSGGGLIKLGNGKFRAPDGTVMGKKAAKAYTLAQQQATINKQTATAQQNLNMVDQVDQFGNTISYKQIGTNPDGTPKYQVTTKLSPQQQALQDQQMGLSKQMGQVAGNQLGAVSQTLSKPLDLGNFDPQAAKDNVLYNLQKQYLNEEFDRQGAGLEQKLANQGIFPGMDAYYRAHDDLSKQQGLQRAQLITAGDQQGFNQAMAGRQNANTETLTERNQPLQELNALRTGSQVSQPQQISTPQAGVANADMLGTYGTMYSANKQAQATQQAGLMGGIGQVAGVGGSLAGKYFFPGA